MARFSYFQICDQLRREDNGKQILIGVYRQAIWFPKLPAKLTSLTILPVLRCTLDDVPQEIYFQLTISGAATRKSRVINVDKDQINELKVDPENIYIDFPLIWNIAPCEFPETGRLAITAVADGKEYYAGSYKVGQPEDSTAYAPDDLTLLGHYRAIGTKESQEASDRLIELVGMPPLKSREVKKYFENLVMTARLGPNKFAAFAADPIINWDTSYISKLPENANVMFDEKHPFFSVFTIDAAPELLDEILVDPPKKR